MLRKIYITDDEVGINLSFAIVVEKILFFFFEIKTFNVKILWK
jgi:hypothetical protein